MSEQLASLQKYIGGYDLYDLGALSTMTPQTVNVLSIIPNYKELTVDNFYLSATGFYTNTAVTVNYTKSYNTSTGVLTLSREYNGYLIGRLIAIVKR